MRPYKASGVGVVLPGYAEGVAEPQFLTTTTIFITDYKGFTKLIPHVFEVLQHPPYIIERQNAIRNKTLTANKPTT